MLRRAEFQLVYERGVRIPSRYFVAFCYRSEDASGPKVGFTASRALGEATVRNRIRRRVRECVRQQLPAFAPAWWVVWNLRREAATAPYPSLLAEVKKVADQCSR